MSALEQVLAGTAPAHLVVVQHALGASPWPLVCEMLARSSERCVLLVHFLSFALWRLPPNTPHSLERRRDYS